MYLILLVLTVICLFLWLLSLLPGVVPPERAKYSDWLAFFTCLFVFLFLAVFVVPMIDRPVAALVR